MPGAVVLVEHDALAREGLRQELRGRIRLSGRPECDVKAFVFEDDDEDMADLAAVEIGKTAEIVCARGGAGGERSHEHGPGERPFDQFEHKRSPRGW